MDTNFSLFFGIFCTVLKTKSPCTSLTYKDFLLLRRSKKTGFSAPPGARTLDPNIKSVVLYQLS